MSRSWQNWLAATSGGRKAAPSTGLLEVTFRKSQHKQPGDVWILRTVEEAIPRDTESMPLTQNSRKNESQTPKTLKMLGRRR